MSDQQHQSDPGILDRRTLQQDHRYLAGILKPGMSVLDVGCGSGAITWGIAEAVGPTGTVVGVDRDIDLIARANSRRSMPANLRFAQGDATNFDLGRQFDIVTSARTLQWIADVAAAVARMVQAAKPGGRIVVLDYNHALNRWVPEPPGPFKAFYTAFLDWRRSNGWDNEMANRLPEYFHAAGLTDIESHRQDETSDIGDQDFAWKTELWTGVIDHLGQTMQAAGFCDAALIEEARIAYEDWRSRTLQKQILSLAAVVGRVPFE